MAVYREDPENVSDFACPCEAMGMAPGGIQNGGIAFGRRTDILYLCITTGED